MAAGPPAAGRGVRREIAPEVPGLRGLRLPHGAQLLLAEVAELPEVVAVRHGGHEELQRGCVRDLLLDEAHAAVEDVLQQPLPGELQEVEAARGVLPEHLVHRGGEVHDAQQGGHRLAGFAGQLHALADLRLGEGALEHAREVLAVAGQHEPVARELDAVGHEDDVGLAKTVGLGLFVSSQTRLRLMWVTCYAGSDWAGRVKSACNGIQAHVDSCNTFSSLCRFDSASHHSKSSLCKMKTASRKFRSKQKGWGKRGMNITNLFLVTDWCPFDNQFPKGESPIGDQTL